VRQDLELFSTTSKSVADKIITLEIN